MREPAHPSKDLLSIRTAHPSKELFICQNIHPAEHLFHQNFTSIRTSYPSPILSHGQTLSQPFVQDGLLSSETGRSTNSRFRINLASPQTTKSGKEALPKLDKGVFGRNGRTDGSQDGGASEEDPSVCGFFSSCAFKPSTQLIEQMMGYYTDPMNAGMVVSAEGFLSSYIEATASHSQLPPIASSKRPKGLSQSTRSSPDGG